MDQVEQTIFQLLNKHNISNSIEEVKKLGTIIKTDIQIKSTYIVNIDGIELAGSNLNLEQLKRKIKKIADKFSVDVRLNLL